MMRLTTNYKPKLFILAIVGMMVVYLVTYFILKVEPKTPNIVSSSPSNQAKNIPLDQSLTFNLDQEVELSDLTITSNPKIVWTLAQQSPGIFVANHSLEFQPATKYVVNVSWKDNLLLPIEFTTLSAQTDPLLIQNMKEELARDYPLARFTPYNELGFRIVYSAPLTLQATLTNLNLTESEVIQEMREWVTKNGGNATIHKFIVVSPSPTN